MPKKPFWRIKKKTLEEPNYIDVNNILDLNGKNLRKDVPVNKKDKIPQSWTGKPVLIPIEKNLTKWHVVSIAPNKLRHKFGNIAPKGRQPRKERQPRKKRQPRERKDKPFWKIKKKTSWKKDCKIPEVINYKNMVKNGAWDENTKVTHSLVGKNISVIHGKDFVRSYITREKVGFRLGDCVYDKKVEPKSNKKEQTKKKK